jgi:hypothetical protein
VVVATAIYRGKPTNPPQYRSYCPPHVRGGGRREPRPHLRPGCAIPDRQRAFFPSSHAQPSFIHHPHPHFAHRDTTQSVTRLVVILECLGTCWAAEYGVPSSTNSVSVLQSSSGFSSRFSFASYSAPNPPSPHCHCHCRTVVVVVVVLVVVCTS